MSTIAEALNAEECHNQFLLKILSNVMFRNSIEKETILCEKNEIIKRGTSFTKMNLYKCTMIHESIVIVLLYSLPPPRPPPSTNPWMGLIDCADRAFTIRINWPWG